VTRQDAVTHAPLAINIGEAARMIGVSPSTLRAWEAKGLVSPERSASGYRRYPLAQVERLARQVRDSGTAITPVPGDTDERSEPSPRLPVSWGSRLREQRQQRSLSLRQAAQLTGLSASYISGIERAIANPSVAALQKLTAAYGINIVELAGAPGGNRGRLVRVAERQRYDAAAGVLMEQLDFGQHQMELHLFTVAPGASTGGPFHHEGEEFILLLEGELLVTIDTLEQYLLQPGDVLYFESWRRHEWINPGDEPAVFLGVNTPRTF
jgi:DNA-binding transcriptional MerR regulator/quercetin dioxygenase-like cupin family protein